MRVITIKNLTLQFHSEGNPDPVQEANEILELCNLGLSRSPDWGFPQIVAKNIPLKPTDVVVEVTEEGCPNCDGTGRDTCPLCDGTNIPFPEDQETQ